MTKKLDAFPFVMFAAFGVAGRNYIGVIAPPATGQTTPRFFVTQACQ